ncbi:MAG: hypothetical protein HKO55_00865 [Gammaproteobacteria bacterium]|nr:hypothetical protein [Gammaproteobacteria bacterium]NNM19809.1 hypothetical protein [Gammaproteobacteria bacterium]
MGAITSGKYRAIVISIALFIVFDAGVLIMNFYIANQFARDATEVNLAGRQRTLSQRLLKALLQTDNALGSGNYIDVPLNELKSSFRLFDDTLNAFNKGGEVMGVDGDPVLVEALDDPYARRMLTETIEQWLPLREALQPMLAFDAKIDRSAELIMTDAGAELEGDLFHAIMVATAEGRDTRLHELTNGLTVHMEYESTRRAARLRIIQVTGICLALINFFVILFHFIRNLNKYDAMIEQARKETGEILETVNEGLFLLDSEYRIGTQHSAALSGIFRRDNLGGVNLIELLRGIVPETTLNVARDYISLFFGKRVNQALVDDLNPLNEVEVHFGGDSSMFQTRYLGFEFRRVLVDDQLSHLLVTVNDITEKVALERELQESRARSSAQLDMLMDILHIEPEMLTDFLCGSERSLGKINSILRRPAKGIEVYKAKLDQIFREVHTVKGEAAALGLNSVEIHAHELEDLIAEIQERPSIRGSDFLPLTIKLDEVLGHIQSVRELVARLIDFRTAFDRSSIAQVDDDQRSAPRTDMSALMHNLAERIADEQGKRVNLHCVGLEGRHVPEAYRGPLKDMALQFIRNGVTHGIEPPGERNEANKGQVGRIAMKFMPLNGTGFEFSYRDDGRGLDLDLIRRTAVEKGFVTADQIDTMEERAVMALIFQRGFSTCEQVSTDAGRGVGMDVIRNLVNELNGKVRVSTARGEFTQFKITLPAIPSDMDQAA